MNLFFVAGFPAESPSASCGPVVCGEKFSIILDRVEIVEYEVRVFLLCVHGFVRRLHFNLRNFFSDYDIAMLNESAAIFDSIRTSAVCSP